MTELEKALLNKVKELEEENERLNKLVDKLHADCFYYENHRREHHHIYPRNLLKEQEEETDECPFI